MKSVRSSSHTSKANLVQTRSRYGPAIKINPSAPARDAQGPLLVKWTPAVAVPAAASAFYRPTYPAERAGTFRAGCRPPVGLMSELVEKPKKRGLFFGLRCRIMRAYRRLMGHV